MKIKNDCARKILIEIEKIPFGETLTVSSLQEKIQDFSIEDVLAIITLFNKEHYLVVLDKASYDDNDMFRDNKIKCLTERGYKTLDLIRDDKMWNLMKNKLNNFEDLSFFTITSIANELVGLKYKRLFDLPNDLIAQDIR